MGRQDSNLGSRDQNPLPYRLATPQQASYKPESTGVRNRGAETLLRSGENNSLAMVANGPCRIARVNQQWHGRDEGIVVDAVVVGDDQCRIVDAIGDVVPRQTLPSGQTGVGARGGNGADEGVEERYRSSP